MGIFNFFKSSKPKHKYIFQLAARGGVVEYYNPFLNFLIYGGMGCGKTKSIGKPLLKEYLKNGFAGFIYDFKDLDFTKTAYNLLMSEELKDYPYSYHVINFAQPQYSSRTNPISPDVITDENLFIQLIDDMLKAYISKEAGRVDNDVWVNGALGLFQGIAFRFYKDYPQYCTIPHIVMYSTQRSPKEITEFLKQDPQSRGLAGAFLNSERSVNTQASYQSTLSNYLSSLSFNKNILYILSGNDFSFNLIDPAAPKLVSMASSFQIDKIISPVVALMLGVSTRQFSMSNKIPFFYLLDEATTFKINDFQTLCSVLREYLCSFTFITQSSSKIEYLYTSVVKSIIEANFGNHFYGRTGDLNAIQKYPIMFGRRDTEKISKTKGGMGERKSSSRTVSTQKENVYDPEFFTELKPGEFVCSAAQANKKKFVAQFKQFDLKEEYDLPIEQTGDIKKITEENYKKILEEIYSI